MKQMAKEEGIYQHNEDEVAYVATHYGNSELVAGGLGAAFGLFFLIGSSLINTMPAFSTAFMLVGIGVFVYTAKKIYQYRQAGQVYDEIF